LLLLLHLQFTKVSTMQIFRNLTILLLAPKPHTTVVDTAIHAHYIAHHHHGATTTTARSSNSSSRVPSVRARTGWTTTTPRMENGSKGGAPLLNPHWSVANKWMNEYNTGNE
jgi:hypothetical protein